MKLSLVAHRSLIGSSLFACVLLASWWLSQPGSISLAESNDHAERVEGSATSAELEAGPEDVERVSLVLPPAPVELAPEKVEIPESNAPVESRVWKLIVELEKLATDEATFHESALRVMTELTEACEDEQLSAELLETVVHASERNSLVRGAVLVAVAELLPQPSFELGLLSWFGSERTPLELLRAAAIAAALRGEDSRCGLPLDLDFLGGLQRKSDVGELHMPRVFPLRLKRRVSQAHADVLRRWLLNSESRATALHAAAEGPDMPAIADIMVTAETLYAVWGYAALSDHEVEAVVLEDAFKPEEERTGEGLIFLRVANFLVHSLAPCNDQFFELAMRMGESEDVVLGSLASSMEGHLSNGIGVSLLAKIESVRYSVEAGAYAELTSYLLDIGRGLDSMTDPEQLEEALTYLDDIIQDEMVHEAARSTAIMILEEHATWETLVQSVERALHPAVTSGMYAMAVTSLANVAASDPARRATAVELLKGARERVTDGGIRSSLSSYIEQLSH